MIDKDTQIAVTLNVQEWTFVLNLIADGPYKTAAPLIKKVSEQIESEAKRVAGNNQGFSRSLTPQSTD